MLAICIGISRYAIQKMRMNGTENIHFSVSNTFTNGVATENNPISRGNITKLLVFILLLTIFLILFLSSCLDEKTGKSTVCIEVLMLSIINAGNCLPLSKYANMDGVENLPINKLLIFTKREMIKLVMNIFQPYPYNFFRETIEKQRLGRHFNVKNMTKHIR